MTITVNGKPMELPAGLTIDGLLAHLKVRREFTAVALNREVALRAQNVAAFEPTIRASSRALEMSG